MSLILLFFPSPVINQQPLSPAVVQAIETVRPTLVFVEKASGQFQESTTEYSSSTVAYNTGTYGGADRVLGQAPVVYSIDTTKPTMYKLSKL